MQNYYPDGTKFYITSENIMSKELGLRLKAERERDIYASKVDTLLGMNETLERANIDLFLENREMCNFIQYHIDKAYAEMDEEVDE